MASTSRIAGKKCLAVFWLTLYVLSSNIAEVSFSYHPSETYIIKYHSNAGFVLKLEISILIYSVKQKRNGQRSPC